MSLAAIGTIGNWLKNNMKQIIASAWNNMKQTASVFFDILSYTIRNI